VELIQEVKQEMKSVVDEDDCELTRTATPPIFTEVPEPRDEDIGLSRQTSVAPTVSAE